jgi:hypothetical protein
LNTASADPSRLTIGRANSTFRFLFFSLSSIDFLNSGVWGSLIGLQPTWGLAAIRYVAVLLVALPERLCHAFPPQQLQPI